MGGVRNPATTGGVATLAAPERRPDFARFHLVAHEGHRIRSTARPIDAQAIIGNPDALQ